MELVEARDPKSEMEEKETTKDIQDWGCESDDKCIGDKGWGKRHKSFSPPDFEQTYDSFSDRIKDTSLPDSKTNPRILYLYSPPIIYF